jgi:hypothetical protein
MLWRAFVVGLHTNLTNPKAALFFGSIFAAFLTPDVPPLVRWISVALLGLNCALWHAVLAYFLDGDGSARVCTVATRNQQDRRNGSGPPGSAAALVARLDQGTPFVAVFSACVNQSVEVTFYRDDGHRFSWAERWLIESIAEDTVDEVAQRSARTTSTAASHKPLAIP